MRIDPFPGVLTKLPVPGGRDIAGVVYKYFLTEDQREWFIKWFPEVENSRLMETSGMKSSTLHRFARELGLVKSRRGLHRIKKRQAAGVKKKLEANGYYVSLRGKPVSEACHAGTVRMWQEIREGKRLHPIRKMKKDNPRKYRQRRQRISESRKRLFAKEKLRIKYGLGRKTRLHIPLAPYTRSQTSHRHNALKRGYFFYDGKLTDNDRYIIFYDDRTRRSERFEENLRKDHFNVIRYEEGNEDSTT